MSGNKSVLQRHMSRGKGGSGAPVKSNLSLPLWQQARVSQRNDSNLEWFYGTSLKIRFAIKLVLLIQAIINTEKVFTDFFGISAISVTKNQHIYIWFVPQIDLILKSQGNAI